MTIPTDETVDLLGEIIIVGEPGCYILPGHQPLPVIWRMAQHLFQEFDEEWWSLEAPRHTFMLVTDHSDDFDWDGETPFGYEEVTSAVQNAQPCTLFAVRGHWNGVSR